MNELAALLINGMPQNNITITPPMGLFKLRHYLLQRDISCDIYSPDIDNESEFLSETKLGRYDIIGISCSHWNMVDDIERLRRFKDAGVKSGKQIIYIAGGQEASQNYDQWLDNGIDAVFLGFAEKNLYLFCRRLLKELNNIDLPKILGKVNGVVYRGENNQSVFRPTQPLTEEFFSKISYKQALTLEIPYKKYWDALRERTADTNSGSAFVFEYVRLYTTSHCPMRCGFCNSQAFLPSAQTGVPKIYYLSADQIVDLVLINIKKYGARGFAFSDDDFPIGNRSGIERIFTFSKKIISLKARGEIDNAVHFAIQARISDFFDLDNRTARVPDIKLMRVMHQAGFRSVALGVETFTERLLHVPSVNKLNTTVDDIHSILNAMIDAKLVPLLNIILGIPEYKPEELFETLETSIQYILKGCEINMTGPLYALPGAPIYTDSRYKKHSIEWDNSRTGEKEIITHHYIPENAIIRELVLNYEKQLFKELEQIRKKYDWEEKIIHKRIKNVVAIIVAAKLLKRADMATRFMAIVDEMISGKMRIE